MFAALAYDPQKPGSHLPGYQRRNSFRLHRRRPHWARFAHLGSGDDYVIDHLAIDPQNPNKMYAAAWSVENQQAGDLFR